MEVKLGKKYSGAKFGRRGAGVGPGAAVGRGVSGAGSGFRVAWRAAGSRGGGGGLVLFFGIFLLVLAGLLYLWGGGALRYHVMKFRHFPQS